MGGGLQQMGGYSLPLAVTAALVAVDFILRVFVLPAPRMHGRMTPDLRALLLDKSVLVPALATALAALGWGVAEPLLPLDLERRGATAAQIGLIFTAAPIAYGLCAPLVAWTTERVAIRWWLSWVLSGWPAASPRSVSSVAHLRLAADSACSVRRSPSHSIRRRRNWAMRSTGAAFLATLRSTPFSTLHTLSA